MVTEFKLEELTTIIRGGFLVPKNDTHLSKWQIEEQKLDHDNHLPPLVCSHLEEGMVVMDIGAFNGDHTKAYSDKVGKNGMVLACEAGKLAFECLKHNCGLFEHKNVFPIHTCISEVNGYSVSHSTNENLGASVCHEVERKDLKEGHSYLMTCTLDFLAHQSQRKIDFIKMDVEGWEAKALIGAHQTLKKDRPKLLIEVNEHALMGQGDTPEDIFHILNLHGYEWTIAQPELSIGAPMYDLICIPQHK